jgi:hypothetical protein
MSSNFKTGRDIKQAAIKAQARAGRTQLTASAIDLINRTDAKPDDHKANSSSAAIHAQS